MSLHQKMLLKIVSSNFFINFPKHTIMNNFEILSAEQLLEVKGGHNELTSKDVVEDCIV